MPSMMACNLYYFALLTLSSLWQCRIRAGRCTLL